ncbi:BNR-4 repeat-containing protein [Novipirellula sp. SH528]|uniref:BNR-4 repeat-containing protein n=1 Tax=Novipirellula sp. SH528 TaxID=3454466 RepID=UPI003F9EBFA1
MNLIFKFACVGIVAFLCSEVHAKEPETGVRTVNGYKGIWFTLGQYYGKGEGDQAYGKVSRTPTFPYGDKYSGGLGTYTAKHTPLAIYCKDVDKTFFVYGGTTAAKDRHLLCMISYYDHKTNQVPRPVVVYDKNGVDDPHDNPSLAVDRLGHLWVFVSGRGRGRPGFKFRSLKPYSIEGFEQISEEEMTYPQPHYLDQEESKQQGFLHLFTKYTGVRELYFERSVDGVTWSEDEKLAGIREPGHKQGGHYQTSATLGGKTGTFMNRHPNGNVDQRTDLYYVQTEDMGRSWTTVSGDKLSVPLTELKNSARVMDYASLGLNVYLKDMGFDEDGYPVVLYVTSHGHEPGPPNGPRFFCLTRWDGKAWQTTKICETDHNYDMGSLYLENSTWTVRIPSLAGPQPHHGGGEMVNWVTSDRGNTWLMKKTLTHSSPRNHNYARRPINAKNPFFVFWADGDPTQLSESHLYFSNASGDTVWRLPYEMTEPMAHPIPVTP